MPEIKRSLIVDTIGMCRALLDGAYGRHSGLVDSEDLFGHTALEYAFFLLTKCVSQNLPEGLGYFVTLGL